MKSLAVLLAALFLTGCQSLPTARTTGAPASMERLSHWNISGRLGYRAGDDGGTASLDWRQR